MFAAAGPIRFYHQQRLYYLPINQKGDLSIGTQIKNKAAIYFDYNLPVITNSTLNTISAVTGVLSAEIKNNLIQVYPNPNSGDMILKYVFTQSDKGMIKIYDLTGKLIEEHLLDSNNTELLLSTNLNNGIYLYQVIVNNRAVKSDKLVIIR